MNAMHAFRSEWILLNRRRLWLGMGATTLVFAVAATVITLSTADSASSAGRREGGGLSLDALTGAGGATAAVVFAIGFGSVLVLAAFASSTGNEFSRGTLRAALTRHPRRSSLFAGKLAARVAMAALLMAGALAAGAATAAVFAPTRDIATRQWFGGAALGAAGADYLRLLGFVVMYALIGTTLAVLVRSTPVALGAGLLWFGPIENVIGEGRAWADRWFPGLVLRSLVQPDTPGGLATSTAVVTLAGYAAVCVAVVAGVMARRDVTS